jgi:hypothetical protein
MDFDLDLRLARHSTDKECADCGQTFTPIGRERVCPYCARQERDAARDRERAL